MAKTRTAPGRIRVMATLDRGLVERVDVLADLEDRSRSQIVGRLLHCGLPQYEEMAMREMSERKEAEGVSRELADEQRSRVESLRRLRDARKGESRFSRA